MIVEARLVATMISMSSIRRWKRGQCKVIDKVSLIFVFAHHVPPLYGAGGRIRFRNNDSIARDMWLGRFRNRSKSQRVVITAGEKIAVAET